MKIHWAFRLVLSILCIALMPLIGIVVLIFLMFDEFGCGRIFKMFNYCLHGISSCRMILLFPIIIPFYLTWYILVFAFAVACSVLVVAVGIIPAYLMLFIVSVITPIRFFCCPKRK